MWDNIRWTIEDLGFTNILVIVVAGIVEISFVIGIVWLGLVR